jgi:hypothetical protein
MDRDGSGIKAHIKTKSMWQCSDCGRTFANKNQLHSCGPYTVADFLGGKSDAALALYHRFVESVRSCGPVFVVPAKTRVGFQVRMIFAAVNKLSDRGLDGHVIVARRADSPRFRKIERLSVRSYVHHFRIKGEEEIDEEVRGWLKEAYRVGRQEHLRGPRRV